MDSDDLQVITKAMRKELRFHWKRTGVPSSGVIKTAASLPAGVTVALLSGWINGTIDKANPAHWELVMGLWSALPDCERHKTKMDAPRAKAGRRHPKDGEVWIDVTPDMATQFRAELARTNADIDRDILNAPDAPNGLTRRVLHVWLYTAAKTTRAAHWEFVMAKLHAMDDFKSVFVTQMRTKD